MRFAWVFIVAACGGGSGPQGIQSGPPAAFIAVPPPGDVQVATVNGRPVFGSCVAEQSKRMAVTREIAVQQCIDLELLAQAAEGKQLATTAEVIDATRTALVRRVVDAFEAKYPDPESLRVQIDEVYQKVGTHTRPASRVSRHAIVLAGKDASADVHTAAREIAEQIYQQLKDETGLFPAQLDAAVAAAERPGITVKTQDLGTTRDDQRWAPEFRGALFAIPEVGRVSPVVKTEYGYHVLLMTELRPESEVERTTVFGGLRRQLFVEYINELMAKSTILVDGDAFKPQKVDAP